MYAYNFSDWLKVAIKNKGISVYRLAQMTGIDKGTLHRAVHSKDYNITWHNARIIFDAIGEKIGKS